MAREINLSHLDIDTLINMELDDELLEGFEKKKKSKKFDDGTKLARPAKKKESNRIVEEDEN